MISVENLIATDIRLSIKFPTFKLLQLNGHISPMVIYINVLFTDMERGILGLQFDTKFDQINIVHQCLNPENGQFSYFAKILVEIKII